LCVVVPFKIPPRGNLTYSQSNFNGILNKYRCRIEQKFGRLKSRFNILLKPFRGKYERLDQYVIICTAILEYLEGYFNFN